MIRIRKSDFKYQISFPNPSGHMLRTVPELPGGLNFWGIIRRGRVSVEAPLKSPLQFHPPQNFPPPIIVPPGTFGGFKGGKFFRRNMEKSWWKVRRISRRVRHLWKANWLKWSAQAAHHHKHHHYFQLKTLIIQGWDPKKRFLSRFFKTNQNLHWDCEQWN